MVEKFIEFLENNNAYKEFYKNFKDRGDYDSIDDLFEAEHPALWIVCAFNWSNTPEGFKYWDKLDTLWCKVNCIII